MIDIAIVGAGPAGSNCAYNLARRGIHATIFDHSFPREKPCGGMMGLSDKEVFSILEGLPIEHSVIEMVRVISPSQRTWNIDMANNKLLGFSRLRFDQYLLDQALGEGTDLVKEKVVGLQKKRSSWSVVTQKGSYESRIVVGADGVSSLVRRRIVGSLDKSDLGACFGYIVRGVQENTVIIKFLPSIEGYIWVVPRGDTACIGGGAANVSSFRELKTEVNVFIKRWYPQLERISEWAALIPNVKNPKAFLLQVAGSDWVLIGDAAGHVSPILGSGIAYALMDGELAAEAIADGQVEQFNKMWVESYGKQLLLQSRLRGLIYQKQMLELYCMFMKFHWNMALY